MANVTEERLKVNRSFYERYFRELIPYPLTSLKSAEPMRLWWMGMQWPMRGCLTKRTFYGTSYRPSCSALNFKKIVHPPSCLCCCLPAPFHYHHHRPWLPHFFFVTLKCIRRKSKLEFNDIITENCNCAFGIRIRPSNHEQITLIFPLLLTQYLY